MILGCALLLVLAMHHISKTAPTIAEPHTACILIDPGHGGEDGGAIAADGTMEKDINLAISLPLADMLRVFGYDVRMTRTEDISIHSTDAAGIRNKKVSDMKNRLALYNQAAFTVSIHENHFPQSQYYGTQVFYSPNDAAGPLLGNAIRDSVLRLLQPDNKRELKKGNGDIYLLSKTTTPAVLVECGFLSNEAEREKLKTEEYQRKMAFAIAGGVLDFADGFLS